MTRELGWKEFEVAVQQITTEFFSMRVKDFNKIAAVVDAAKRGPCRHSSDMKGEDCELCKALKDLDK